MFNVLAKASNRLYGSKVNRHLHTSTNTFLSKCNRTFDANLQTYKNNIAIIQDDNQVTYDELNQRINAICYMFQNKYNLTKGDTLMHLSRHRIDDIAIFMACSRLGIIYISVNHNFFTSQQLIQISEASHPSLVIMEPQFYDYANKINPNIKRVILTEEFNPQQWFGQEANHVNVADIDIPTIKNDDPYQIIFTSGTTGQPKGVIHSHSSTYHAADKSFCNYVGRTTQNKDSTLPLGSLADMSGIIQRLSVLFEGSTLIYPNKYQVRNFEHIHDLCENKHISISRLWLRGLETSRICQLNKRFNHIDLVMYSGDFHPFKTISYCKQHIFTCKTKFKHHIGSTEAMVICDLDPAILDRLIDENRMDANVLVPVGIPIDDKLIKIANDGELMVKCLENTGMIGYLNDTKLTQEVLNDDGWLYTGDLAFIDKNDGLLYIQGRKIDIIKTDMGNLIKPIQVETLLLTHSKVKQVAVIGYPNQLIDHKLCGEFPVAFVALKEHEKYSNNELNIIKSELLQLGDEIMGDVTIRVHEIFFIAELPNNGWKVTKNVLRDMIRNGDFPIQIHKK